MPILSRYLNFKYIFNLILLLWIISIPFKNAFYQGSTLVLISIFIVYILINRDFTHIKNLILLYKDIALGFLLILFSMTISNYINDVSMTNAWHLEFAYIYRYAFILFILFYFYSKSFFDKNLLVMFVLISLGMQVLDGIYQGTMGTDLFGNATGDLNGWRGAVFNRNVFGLLMGLGVLLSFLSIKSYSKINLKSSILSIFLCLFVVATLFSYSRAVWVALFTVFVLYLIINSKKFNKLDLFYLFAILVIVFLIFFNIDTLQSRFLELIKGNPSNRDAIWLHCIQLFREKLIFGWGLNAWNIHGLKEYANIHNSILEILVSLGIFGFLVFSYFLILLFKEINKNKNFNAFYLLIFLMVDSQFDQSVISSKILLCIGVILIFYIYFSRTSKMQYRGNDR